MHRNDFNNEGTHSLTCIHTIKLVSRLTHGHSEYWKTARLKSSWLSVFISAGSSALLLCFLWHWDICSSERFAKCLLNCVQNKCDQYWPSRGTETYGLMQVSLLDTVELATYCVRTFALFKVMKLQRSAHKHCVTTLCYTNKYKLMVGLWHPRRVVKIGPTGGNIVIT